MTRACPACGADLTGAHGKRVWCSDKCRKTKYAGTCIDCGGPTSGTANGIERAPERCITCARQRFADRNALLCEMWEAEEPVSYIAEKCGMTEEAVYSWLHLHRHRYGQDIPLGRLGGDFSTREARRHRMIELKREGRSNAEIAEITGFASADSVSVAFADMRKKGWDVPSRSRLPVRAEDVIALYEEGLPLREMARRLGFSGSSAVSNRLSALERQGYRIQRRRPRKVPA